MITTFLLSVAAGVVAYYVCKWLDRKFRSIAALRKSRKAG